MKFTQVHWLGKEFNATAVTQKFAKITILLLQCANTDSAYFMTWFGINDSKQA